MRSVVGLLAIGTLLAGCSSPKSKPAQSNGGPPPEAYKKIIVTPEKALVGTVARVNATLRFAVLNYPVGRLPALGQQLNLYRRGLKVGELKVTGPQQDDNIVAEITSGEAQPGDELRSN